MNGGEIIEIPSASGDFPSGRAILYKADSDRYVVIQPGLGVNVSDSQMAKALIQAVVGKYNVVFADHPGCGINGGMLHPKNFTTHACKKHSMSVLETVLGWKNCKKVGIVGGSLGAFSMKEALSHLWDPRIQFFIKSGIVSYEAIVKRLGGVENVLKNILRRFRQFASKSYGGTGKITGKFHQINTST